MALETQMIENMDQIPHASGEPKLAPPKAVMRDAAEFAHDLLSLTELQAVLFREDAKRGFRRLAHTAGLFALATVFMLAAIPIGLAAVAHWLHHTGWSLPAAFAIASACGALMAIVFGVAGCVLARSWKTIFSRSQQEFVNNHNWLKRVIAEHRNPASS